MNLDSPQVDYAVCLYRNQTIYDRDICQLVGINMYATLWHQDSSLWYQVVNPMPDNTLFENLQPLIVDGFTYRQIKAELVKFIVDRKCHPQIMKIIPSICNSKPYHFHSSTTAEIIIIVLEFLFIAYVIWLLFYLGFLQIGWFTTPSIITPRNPINVCVNNI